MNGWDFGILWKAARAVLEGQSPYTVPDFFYPLPIAYILSPLGLLPESIAFGLWLLLNFALLVYFFKKQFWKWLLYVPVMHLFSAGQVGLVFWAMEHAVERGKRGAFVAALITLQPQAALILLPWHLLDWLRHDRQTLAQWLGITSILWALPLLSYPNWPADWRAALPDSTWQSSASNAPSIFSLLKLLPDLWPALLPIAAIIALWGVTQSKFVSRAAIMFSSPVGLFYFPIYLIEAAPARLLVPVSLLAAAVTLATMNFVPFAMLPLAVLLWHRFRPVPDLHDASNAEGISKAIWPDAGSGAP